MNLLHALPMNFAQQAKNGFKTFILTFFLSVFVFGAFYYLISDLSAQGVSIEDAEKTGVLGSSRQVSDASIPSEPVTQPQQPSEPVAEPTPVNNESVFSSLIAQAAPVDSPAVLAAGTTQSTTPIPETGEISVTFGILSSLVLLGLFSYLIIKNPRNYALSKFEKDIVDEL